MKSSRQSCGVVGRAVFFLVCEAFLCVSLAAADGDSRRSILRRTTEESGEDTSLRVARMMLRGLQGISEEMHMQEEQQQQQQQRLKAWQARREREETERKAKDELAFEQSRKQLEEMQRKQKHQQLEEAKKLEERMKKQAHLEQLKAEEGAQSSRILFESRMARFLQSAHREMYMKFGSFQGEKGKHEFMSLVEKSDIRSSWASLTVGSLAEPLRLVGLPALGPPPRVLVLEPNQKLRLGEKFVESLKLNGSVDACSFVFDSEPEGPFDVVLELGLVDDIAMYSELEEESRLQKMRRAGERFTSLVRPGGAWISISSAPPSLRLPLLQRLTSHTFLAADPKHGVHHVTVQRGHAHEMDVFEHDPKAFFADMILNGDTNLHVFTYSLHRQQEEATTSPLAELGMRGLEELRNAIRLQRPFVLGDEL